MAFAGDPCTNCGGDPTACECSTGPPPASYRGLVHGPGEDPEPNCPVCLARLRYCPGDHGIPDRYRPGGMNGPEHLAPNPMSAATRGSHGYFDGDPIGVFTPDGSRMALVEEFAYIDPRYRMWKVPRGAILDGSSVPSAFWALVGSPYRGKYRYAAIVHDYHCKARGETWDATHAMFYTACLAGGLTITHAKVLYYSVYHFGPKWRDRKNPYMTHRGRIAVIDGPQVEVIERWIVEGRPDLAGIRATPPPELGVHDTYNRR